MKIWTQGCRETYCQLPRIEEGFVKLGYTLTNNIAEADIVYVNNAWYDSVIAQRSNIKGTIVFNVLDLAPHIPDFPVEKLKKQLAHCHVVTSISETVQKDLFNRTGFDSTVIYQPIQKIARGTNKDRFNVKYLFIGRVRDPNKRAFMGAEAIFARGDYEPDQVVSVGPEQGFMGYSLGQVTEEMLNSLYNSVDYVIFPSKEEGIGLPMIEAMAAGAIPVVCNDLSTAKEFLPAECCSWPIANSEAISRFMVGLDNNPRFKDLLRNHLHQHYLNNLAEKFSPEGVAKRILEAIRVKTNIEDNA